MREIRVLSEGVQRSEIELTFVARAIVPDGLQPSYADPQKESVYPEVTAEELAALRAGEIVERQERIVLPPGTDEARSQAALDARQAAYQAEIDAGLSPGMTRAERTDGVWGTAPVEPLPEPPGQAHEPPPLIPD